MNLHNSQAWCLLPVFLALQRLQQEDCSEFEATVC